MLERKPGHKTLTRKKRLNPRGKGQRSLRRQAWQAEMMETYPVCPCEWPGCREVGIDNAHRLKKDKIRTREEYVHGRARLCRSHHNALDEATGPWPHELMYLAITAIMTKNGRHWVTTESIEMDALIERLGVSLTSSPS